MNSTRRKLIRFAKACRLKVLFKDCPDEAYYSPHRREIVLDKDLRKHEITPLLLHELGHSLDDHLTVGEAARLQRAYVAVYSGKFSRNQIEQVIACEHKAWLYGELLARSLSIRLGKWFHRVRAECLYFYRRERKNAKN
jgi:hypothetical protein